MHLQMATLKKQKSKQKKLSKKKSVSKDLDYVNSLDLVNMYEEFTQSFNDNGTPKYKTIWSYITAFTKDAKKRDILYWLLGPKVTIEKGQIAKYDLDQYDWESKRRNGFWFTSDNIENLKQDIHSKASAYASVKEAGKVNLDTIAVLNGLLKQVLDEFGGGIFLSKLSIKENAFRAQLLLQLIEKITSISNNAQLMYARTQGLDLERLDQFFQLFGTSMGRTAALLMGNQLESSEDDKNNQLQKQFSQVVKMVTQKSTEYELPIPTDIADAIKIVEAENTKPKKQKVQ